jgi:hypothetical protein
MNYCHEKLLSLFRRYRLYSLYILNHINKKLHTFIITNQTITLVGKQYKDSAYICSYYTKMCKIHIRRLCFNIIKSSFGSSVKRAQTPILDDVDSNTKP